MLFAVVRIIFGILVFTASYFFIKKPKTTRSRRRSIIALIVTVVLTTIFSLIPIENAFVTFSSPESAYNYKNTGSVKLVVDGETADFVVGEKGDTDVYEIVPKSKEGWKLGVGFDTKRVNQIITDGIAIYVYQYRNSNDYFITVMDTNGGAAEITDTHNSAFKYLEKLDSAQNKTLYVYFAHVNSLDDQYTLTVNGKLIKFGNSVFS